MSKKAQRKEQRPDQILEAAFEEFAVNGYAGTRLDDVATRAGISKGLVYVYFKTKEELFKAVVRAFIVPRFDALLDEVQKSGRSSEELIRGPILGFMKEFARSRRRILIRLLIAEGAKHPDLTQFYHGEVMSRGLRLLSLIIKRGVAAGEFKPSPYEEFPQLFVAPMLVAVVWQLLFEPYQKLDAERLLESHIEIVLMALKAGLAVPSETRAA